MEKILNEYKQWLQTKHQSNTNCSMISRIKRISNYYNILDEYALDKCASLIDSLTYTRADKKNGVEPKTDIPIEGDYITGLTSLRQALCAFIEFLNSIGYAKPLTTNTSVALFKGTWEDFNRYIMPKCRNEVNIFCKKEREKHNSVCEYCGQTAVLESAHKTERPIIVKDILDKHYKKNATLYEVNLAEFLELFKQAHMPIKENIFFLCKKCHNALDKKKIITADDIIAKRKN